MIEDNYFLKMNKNDKILDDSTMIEDNQLLKMNNDNDILDDSMN